MSSTATGILAFLGFVILFPLLWVFVCTLIAFVGGWRALAQKYRSDAPFRGAMFHMRSGRMRFANYNGVLSVGANERGLKLSVFALFRAGHPSLFVPWQDIDTRDRRTLFFKELEFGFRQVPGVPLRLRQQLGHELLRHRPPPDHHAAAPPLRST